MDVSIIIVSYNTKDLLKNCIISIFEQVKDLSFEIIVVDNGSKDGSVTMLKNNFPSVKIIEPNENLGFGRANNLGIEQSEGEFIFFLNPDCKLLNNAPKILIDFIKSTPNCGAAGGNLLDKDLNKNAALGRQYPFYEWIITKSILKIFFPKKYKELRNYQKNFNRGENGEVGFITGADLMVKKAVLDSVGGFDPLFFLYFEETELQYRIKKAGFKIFYVADSKIIHYEGQSYHPAKKLLMLKSEFIYFRLTQGKFVELLVRIVSLPKYLKLLIKSYLFTKKRAR